MRLRDYQVDALNDTYTYFTEHTGNPLVVLPTGAGKSLFIAEWMRGVLAMDPRARILCLTHVRELVAQNHAELIGLWPGAPAGIYSAGLKKRQIGARILFGSVQSLFKKALAIQQCDMLLIDEAHLVPRDATTMYGRIIKELRDLNPNMKVIGLTATPYRMDQGLLYGEGEIFTHVAHETPVRLLIEQGFLAPLVSRTRAGAQIDTTGIHTRLGEFVASELEEAAIEPEVVEKIADDIVANGHDRRGWLFFGVSIKHCELMAGELRARGVTAEVISADTPGEERERIITSFKNMAIQCLCSMGVLTTGFNAKHVDLIALARPTNSTGLYIQMVGRGTRCIGANIEESKANGKANCMVLDYGGNIRRHGPFDEPFAPTARKGPKGDEPGAMPLKDCPTCENEVVIAARVCPVCGHEFPPPERRVNTAADFAPILAPPPQWTLVDGVTYNEHFPRDATKPSSLRANYQCGMTFHQEWVSFNGTGYARQLAERWWNKRAIDREAPVPATTAEAVARARAGEIIAPSEIQLKREGKYTRVNGHRFAGQSVPALLSAGPGVSLPASGPSA
jgi:DNA repair protein RadD